MEPHPTAADVRAAAPRIAQIVRRTPVVAAPWLTGGGSVMLKLETDQPTGSFKVRGAANAMLQLSEGERTAGVVAVSSGNHGRAVAHVAATLGIDATICLSSRVPAVKVAAIEELGARVVVAGPDQEAAEAAARRLADSDGLVPIHPFDDPAVIAGQGTIGLEILDQVPDVRTVVVPLSGGGLAAGIALALQAADPPIAVIGVSQDLGPAMFESIRAGRPVGVVEEDTLADALAGGIGDDNRHSFDLCSRLLDATVLVSEAEIADAMLMAHRNGLTVEGGGAVGLAALATGRVDAVYPVVVVVSGANVDPAVLERIATERG